MRRRQEIDAAIHGSAWRRHRHTDLVRAMCESAVLLCLPVWVMGGWRPGALAFAALVAGPAAGLVLHGTGLVGVSCGAVGAVAYAACKPRDYGYGLSGWVGVGAVFAAVLFAIYGVRRGRRGNSGWE